jgi:hypothetical protein
MTLTGKLLDFYNSSAMREAVLCWYPFAEGSKVLDLSNGALSDLLRRSGCAVETEPEEQRSGHDYDYVVVLDPSDFGVAALEQYRAALGPHGRLLLAYENPYALRFWAGHTAPNTGRPYDTLFSRGDNPLPARMELAARLEKAGFPALSWYYPLTDHWLTSEVYSESYLPNEFFNQRFLPYLDDDPGLRFDERELYREVVRGGAFAFMCGAYLVEACACADDRPCSVDYAAVTAYREPQKRFATILSSDGTACKLPLHEHGKETVRRIAANHAALRALGINALACTVEDDARGMPRLVMPRLELPTLYDYWAERLALGMLTDSEVTEVFDRIRDDIYRAATDGTCYWELVPANCFYEEVNDKLIYFDQEYCSADVSPAIAVARAVSALRYSAVFASEPRMQELYASLLTRYHLQEDRDMIKELFALDTYTEVFGPEHRLLQTYNKENATLIHERTTKTQQAP